MVSFMLVTEQQFVRGLESCLDYEESNVPSIFPRY